MTTAWQVTSGSVNGRGHHELVMLRDGVDITVTVCVWRKNGRGSAMDQCVVHALYADAAEGDAFDERAAMVWVESNADYIGDLTGSADVAAEFPRKTKKVA